MPAVLQLNPRAPQSGDRADTKQQQRDDDVRVGHEKVLIGAVLALCFVMNLAHSGRQDVAATAADPSAARAKEPIPDESLVLAAAVTVARVAPADFVETVLATGSLVAREEIPGRAEVEGLRITEVLADEGMRVRRARCWRGSSPTRWMRSWPRTMPGSPVPRRASPRPGAPSCRRKRA